MWHPEVLPPEWAPAAAELEELGLLSDACLVGGTGLALHFGHRASNDLELMLPVPFATGGVRDRLKGQPGLRILELTPDSLRATLRGITVSFRHDSNPLLFPTDPLAGLQVADARDIACMKIAAIAQRGTRYDFVDLHAASTRFGLASLLELFRRKYAAAADNRTHILASLTHFDEAENEPMPRMLIPREWDAVRTYFAREVAALR